MATELGSAYVQIVPTANGIKGALTEALGGEASTAGQQSGSTFMSSMAKGISTGAKVATAAVATVGTAIVGMTGSFVKGAGEVANYGDHIDKMSQKMGISAGAYQEWDAVLQHSGSSIDSMQKGMITLAKAAEKGDDSFQQLGISEKEVATLSQEDLFAKVISGLQQMGEGSERTALASKLLGGAAKELGPLLNTSAEDTKAMRDRVHELGGVMSDEAVKAAAHYQDSLQDMTTAFDGLKRNMLSEFLPSITTVMDGLTELFSGNSSKGIGLIKEGVSSFVDSLSSVLPEIINVGAEIITSLLSAITDNLPRLIEAGMGAIETLVKGIVDNLSGLLDAAVQILSMLLSMILENLPMLAEAALQIILQLATSLTEMLPELIPSIVEVVLGIVSMLIENLEPLMDAATAIILALGDGMVLAMPMLIEQLPELIAQLVIALIECTPQLLTVGPQLTVQFWTGIANSLPNLLKNIPGYIGQIVQTLKTNASQAVASGTEIVKRIIEGITQTIPEFLETAPQMIAQFIEGIKNTFNDLIEIGINVGTTFKDGLEEIIDEAKTWGLDVMQNFIAGIDEGIKGLKAALERVANAIRDLIGFSEPEDGPLANFHTFAPDMMQLFAQGIKDNTKIVTDQLEKSFDFSNIISAQEMNLAANINSDRENSGLIFNQTINAPQELDPSEIARQTRNANQEMVLRLRTT